MRPTGRTLAMAVVLVLMAASVALSAKAANDVAEQAEYNEATAECTRDLLTQTVVALNQRTVYSNRSAQAQQRVRDALAAVVSASLVTQGPTQGEARKIVKELGDALAQAEALTSKAQAKRDRFEYPTQEQIENCPPPEEER